jgi:hypothetical protein
VAGEGSFVATRALPNRVDGSTRSRVVFKTGVASRDRPMLLALQALLGGNGSVQDLPPAKAHWQTAFRVFDQLAPAIRTGGDPVLRPVPAALREA